MSIHEAPEEELVVIQWLIECVTCDVIASALATHTLYSKVSIHEAPAALHDMHDDMAFTFSQAYVLMW